MSIPEIEGFGMRGYKADIARGQYYLYNESPENEFRKTAERKEWVYLWRWFWVLELAVNLIGMAFTRTVKDDFDSEVTVHLRPGYDICCALTIWVLPLIGFGFALYFLLYRDRRYAVPCFLFQAFRLFRIARNVVIWSIKILTIGVCLVSIGKVGEAFDDGPGAIFDAALGAVGICAAGLLVFMGLAQYEEHVGESSLTIYLENKQWETSLAELRAEGNIP